jgi:hypothetical protein
MEEGKMNSTTNYVPKTDSTTVEVKEIPIESIEISKEERFPNSTGSRL